MVEMKLWSVKYMRKGLDLDEPNPNWVKELDNGKIKTIWHDGYPIDDRHRNLVNTLLKVIENNNIDFHTELDKVLKESPNASND